jgi:formate transporter
MPEQEEGPARQYLTADYVLNEMCEFGSRRLEHLSVLQLLVLGVIGGGFITMGALFSLLLAEGIEAEGPKRLIEGFGFSAGFFFVILSEAVLFTEANVVLPATILYRRTPAILKKIGRFWALAWLGNFAGAFLVGLLIVIALDYSQGVSNELTEIVGRKMAFAATGTPGAWGRALLSGVLANWLVGMAAFFATMGRSIIGKYIPVLLAVSLFVAANLQHSPANMGYFSLANASGLGPGWLPALAWNIVPVGIGNMLGGGLLVALPFWFALRPAERVGMMAEQPGTD